MARVGRSRYTLRPLIAATYGARGLRAFILFIAALALVACSWLPRVHRVVIQQGNVISQEMVDKLKPGMTRRQIAFIMGEPVLRDTFDPDRWDYVYSIDIPNYAKQVVHLSLFFQNDQLSYFTGDLAPTAVKPEAAAAAQSATNTQKATAGG